MISLYIENSPLSRGSGRQCGGFPDSVISVYIEVRDEFTVNVPQAFSPNNDGISDIIKVRGWGIKELLFFKVYNRWGELIYEDHDINAGWDGNHRGESQISGTYVYVVRVKNYKNETFTSKGNFLLLR